MYFGQPKGKDPATCSLGAVGLLTNLATGAVYWRPGGRSEVRCGQTHNARVLLVESYTVLRV